jgi:small conductance mechanosensitive channel
MGSTVTALIWSIAVLMVFERAGFDLGPLIAGAGIAGVALGFGTQALVRDWIAGLFMTLEDHYGIGDIVDLGEASGVVERITLRATVLRGVDGTVWHVPNGQVVRVGNLSQLWSVALLDITVGYDIDLERAQALLLQVAGEVCAREAHASAVLEPPELLGIEAMGVEGVTLRMRVKVRPGSQWALQRALRAAVRDAFIANGLAIAPPRPTPFVRVDSPGAGRETGED